MTINDARSHCAPPCHSPIATLVVIAGVSCVGKSTLLASVTRLGSEALPAALRWPAGARVAFLNDIGSQPIGGGVSPADTMILHYDIFRPVTGYGSLDFSVDPMLAVLNRADTIKVLTLWEEPGILRERARIRRARLWRRLLTVRRFSARLLQFRAARNRRAIMGPWYADPARLRELYDAWFEFCRERNLIEHWVAQPTKGLDNSLQRALGFSLPLSPEEQFLRPAE